MKRYVYSVCGNGFELAFQADNILDAVQQALEFDTDLTIHNIRKVEKKNYTWDNPPDE